MSLTPAERSMRGQRAAHISWLNTEDRPARTEAARAGLQRSFEKQVDPEGTLAPEERAKRAESARKAHMLKMQMASLKARRLRKQGGAQ
jgi:hypothetical protein